MNTDAFLKALSDIMSNRYQSEITYRRKDEVKRVS